jgi:hypothetical protein
VCRRRSFAKPDGKPSHRRITYSMAGHTLEKRHYLLGGLVSHAAEISSKEKRITSLAPSKCAKSDAPGFAHRQHDNLLG